MNETIKKVCKDHSLLVDAFFDKITKIQEACPGIDINFELTAANKYKEELLITLDGVDTLSYKILNSKIKIIYELSSIQSQNEIEKFVCKCKNSENKEGYLSQSFYQININSKYNLAIFYNNYCFLNIIYVLLSNL